MGKTTEEILKEAYELIKDPARWTQTFEAKNSEGRAVDCFDDSAVAWCAVGAVNKVSGLYDPDGLAWHALHSAAKELFGDRISSFITSPARVNDSLGHEAVLQMYGTAIMKFSVGKTNE